MSNGATQWGRRFIDLVAEHVFEMGGAATLTEAQIGLIRRVSAMECALELQEDRLAAGEEVDLDAFARVSSHCRRIWETLGLRAPKRDTTPSINEIVAAHGGRPPSGPKDPYAPKDPDKPRQHISGAPRIPRPREEDAASDQPTASATNSASAAPEAVTCARE
jgi:hypothetical protein